MWRLLYALLPVIQPYVWLSTARMPQWPPERSARFRRLAMGYFVASPVLPIVWLVAAWLVLGENDDNRHASTIAMLIAWAVMFVVYVVCLVHAGIVLLRRAPTPAGAAPQPRGPVLDSSLWRILVALLPLLQPIVWLLIAWMDGRSATERDRYQRLAAGYFTLPLLLATTWSLLGLQGFPRSLGTSGCFLIAAYLTCLTHAGIVLLYHKPATTLSPTAAEPEMQRGLLLDIAVSYSFVLLSMVFLGLFIAAPANRQTTWSDIKNLQVGPGLCWLFYAILTAILADRLGDQGVAPERIRWMILAAILAVPLVYRLCPWAQLQPDNKEQETTSTR